MKSFIGLMMIAVLLCFTVSAFAEDAPTEVILEPGLHITSPMETGAVGFWFPETGAFAIGVSHTIVRAQYIGKTALLDKLSLDIDATIAQEVTQNSESDDKDTLAGIGAKINLNVKEIAPGLTFLPSIGLTALTDFQENKTLKAIVSNFDVAVYGTVLMYKW